MHLRNLPVVSSRKGSGTVNLLQLAEQFHHWIDHSAAGPEYRVWSIRFLRCLLSSVWCLDVLRCSRDQGTDIGADGSCLQGQFKRRRAVTQTCHRDGRIPPGAVFCLISSVRFRNEFYLIESQTSEAIYWTLYKVILLGHSYHSPVLD